MSSVPSVVKQFSPGETVGPYTIVRLLPAGEGGMARVYEALQAGTQQRVALKVALSGKASFLRDEAALMGAFKLRDPHIIRLIPTPIGGGLEERILKDPRTNAWYFAMEYMMGGSLGDWLDRRKKIPVKAAVDIARQTALALDTAHRAGIVHLDVKPSNILFRHPPDKAHQIEAVLTDFGISRPQAHMSGGDDLITSLTIEYASPEQARLAQEHITSETASASAPSDVKIGPASDLYSLATILYEMLAGHLPFQLKSHDDLVYLHKVVYDPPELPIPGVPPELNAILERALHKDPAERYPSARALADDLGRLTASSQPQPMNEKKSRSWLVGAGGLLLGLVIGFVVGQSTAPVAPRPNISQPAVTIPPTLAATAPPPTVILLATETPATDAITEATETVAPDKTNPTVGPTSTRRPTLTPTATRLIPTQSIGQPATAVAGEVQPTTPSCPNGQFWDPIMNKCRITR